MGFFDNITFALNNSYCGSMFNTMSYPSYGYSTGGFYSYPYPSLFNFNYYSFGTSASNSYYFPPSSSKSYNFSSLTKTAAKSTNSGKVSNFGDLTFKRSVTGDLQRDLVNNACSWIGRVNNDATGNRLFSNGKTQHWCADFVTYNTRKTFGNKLPSSFGSSSVSGLMNWGKDNNCYIDVASASNKANFIAKNVRPGDIMIEKRGGKSHTGIVTKVNSDGSFETVEGNTSDKVAKRHYSANSSTLSGFVSLDKYVA